METTAFSFQLVALVGMTAALAYYGYILLLTGVRFIKLHKALKQQGISTVGRVISTRFERVDSDSVHIYPTFEYTTLNGHTQQVEAWTSTDRFQIGHEVKLRYLPTNPEKFDWHDTDLNGYGSIVLGLFCLGLSAVLAWILVMKL